MIADIEKEVIITNVTKVKEGNYGGLRVTVSCYENMFPDPNVDDVYMMTFTLNDPVLKDLMKQLEVEERLDRKRIGERIRLPSGIKVKVTCEELSTGWKKGVKFFNKINSVDLVEVIFVDVDWKVPAREVSFKDWGLVAMTKDKEYTIDKFTFFNTHLPFKISSLMDAYKDESDDEFIHIKGKARLYYSTYPDPEIENKWHVRSRKRFDSRYDDEEKVTIALNIKKIQSEYLNKLRELKASKDFLTVVTKTVDEWNTRFVKESSILENGKEFGIDIDPSLLSSVFFTKGEEEELLRYNYLKSLLSDEYELYYFIKEEYFKYVAFYDKGPVLGEEDKKKNNLIVYDVNLSNVYAFPRCSEGVVKAFLKRIEEGNIEAFLDRVISDNAVGYKKVNAGRDVPKEDWFDPIAEAVFQ